MALQDSGQMKFPTSSPNTGVTGGTSNPLAPGRQSGGFTYIPQPQGDPQQWLSKMQDPSQYKFNDPKPNLPPGSLDMPMIPQGSRSFEEGTAGAGQGGGPIQPAVGAGGFLISRLFDGRGIPPGNAYGLMNRMGGMPGMFGGAGRGLGGFAGRLGGMFGGGRPATDMSQMSPIFQQLFNRMQSQGGMVMPGGQPMPKPPMSNPPISGAGSATQSMPPGFDPSQIRY